MQVTCGPDQDLEGVVVARLVGQLEIQEVGEFWETVCSHLGQESPSLLVDMAGVERLRSTGVGVLIRLLHHVTPLGGKMAIFGCNERVREVLRICELEQVLNVCDSGEEARDRLR